MSNAPIDDVSFVLDLTEALLQVRSASSREERTKRMLHLAVRLADSEVPPGRTVFPVFSVPPDQAVPVPPNQAVPVPPDQAVPVPPIQAAPSPPIQAAPSPPIQAASPEVPSPSEAREEYRLSSWLFPATDGTVYILGINVLPTDDPMRYRLRRTCPGCAHILHSLSFLNSWHIERLGKHNHNYVVLDSTDRCDKCMPRKPLDSDKMFRGKTLVVRVGTLLAESEPVKVYNYGTKKWAPLITIPIQPVGDRTINGDPNMPRPLRLNYSRRPR